MEHLFHVLTEIPKEEVQCVLISIKAPAQDLRDRNLCIRIRVYDRHEEYQTVYLSLSGARPIPLNLQWCRCTVLSVTQASTLHASVIKYCRCHAVQQAERRLEHILGLLLLCFNSPNKYRKDLNGLLISNLT